MRNPLLLTSAITCFALSACGGSKEAAKSPDDSDHAAEKTSDPDDKTNDRTDQTSDNADQAANDRSQENATK